nr:structural maintenance of chromosomes 4 [Cryptomonas sp.]
MSFIPKISIKSIRLENFKSYRGLLEIGPFHAKINGITGLNGSGKSNLVDAVLFVLGRRASKVRFKNLVDLIYFSNLERRLYSSVTIILHNKDIFKKWKKVYEIYITRQIFINNASVYYLNGREIAFSQIVKILMHNKINIKNEAFLILQNDIEKISLLKPNKNIPNEIGLLEYIEDTVGSSRYNEFMLKKKNSLKNFEFKYIFDNTDNNKDIYKSSLFDINVNPLFEKVTSLDKIDLFFFLLTIRIICFRFFLFRYIKENNRNLNDINKKNSKSRSNNHLYYFYLLKISILKNVLGFRKILYNGKIESMRQNFFLFRYWTKSINFKKCFSHLSSTVHIGYNFKIIKCSFLYFYKIYTQQKNSENLQITHQKKYFNKITNTFDKIIINTNTKYLVRFSKFFAKCGLLKKIYHSFLFLEFLKKNFEKVRYYLVRHFFVIYYNEFIKNKQFLTKNFHCLLLEQIKKINFENINIIEINGYFKSFSNGEERKYNFFKKKKSKQYIKKDNIKFQIENLPGIIGITGSFGFVKYPFVFAVLATECSNLKSFLIDTGRNSVNAIEKLRENKVERTTLIIMEKIKHLNDEIKIPSKSKNQLLFSKIYFKKIYRLPIFFIFRKTIVVKDMTEAIKISINNNKNRRKTVTIDGKVIEISGLFSNSGIVYNKNLMLNKNSNNMFWVSKIEFCFLYLKKIISFLDNLKFVFKKLNKKKFKEKFENSKNANCVFFCFFLFFSIFNVISSNKYFLKMTFQIHLQNLVFSNAVLEHKTQLFRFFTNYYLICLGIGIKFFLIIKIIPNIYFNLKKRKKINVRSLKCLRIQGFDGSMLYSIRILFQRKFEQKLKKIEIKLILLIKIILISKKFRELFIYLTHALRLKTVFCYFLNNEFNQIFREIILEKKAYDNLICNITEKCKDLNQKRKRIKIEKKKIAILLKLYDKIFIEKCVSKYSRKMTKNSRIKWEKYSCHKILTLKMLKNYIPKCFHLKVLFSFDSCFNLNISFLNSLYSDIFTEYSIISKKKMANYGLVSGTIFLRQIHIQRVSEFLSFLFDIDIYLKIIYQSISNGGVIEIDSMDPNDPYCHGLFISIRPPDRAWKLISCLSGGERTITSLSIIFSLQLVNPAPWYMMDEIDAALDFRNVIKISIFMSLYNQNSQFIIVSLRNSMLYQSNHLIGVYKLNHNTKILTIKM